MSNTRTMKSLRKLDKVLGILISTGSGSFFDQNSTFDYGKTYEIYVTRSFNNFRASMSTKHRTGYSSELCSVIYGRHTEPSASASGFRVAQSSSQTWEMAFLCLEPDTLYHVQDITGARLKFEEDNLEEEHFQMSTVEPVPDLDLCKEVVQYRNIFDDIGEMELGFVCRGSIHDNCTDEDMELFYKVLWGSVGIFDD